MRKYIKVGWLITSLSLAMSSGSAVANDEQLDRCDHGASGKMCRFDPQPEHGQDCDYHGTVKWFSEVGLPVGGMNEDHCRRPEE